MHLFRLNNNRQRLATVATRGRPKKNPVQRQVEFPHGLSPIPADSHAPIGVRSSGASAQQALNVEDYEKQRKRRFADLLEEDDRMYEQFLQERARMIAESEARLLEVPGQAEDERAH